MIGGLIFVAMITSPVWLGHLYVRPCLNQTIMKRLRRDGRYDVKTRIAVWDPTRGSSARLIGRANASYTLDEVGLVQLRYRPRSGPERHLAGRLPDEVPNRHLSSLVIGLVALAGLIGYVVGALAAGGNDSHRGTGGMIGAAFGWALLYAASSLRMARRRRR